MCAAVVASFPRLLFMAVVVVVVLVLYGYGFWPGWCAPSSWWSTSCRIPCARFRFALLSERFSHMFYNRSVRLCFCSISSFFSRIFAFFRSTCWFKLRCMLITTRSKSNSSSSTVISKRWCFCWSIFKQFAWYWGWREWIMIADGKHFGVVLSSEFQQKFINTKISHFVAILLIPYNALFSFKSFVSDSQGTLMIFCPNNLLRSLQTFLSFSRFNKYWTLTFRHNLSVFC